MVGLFSLQKETKNHKSPSIKDDMVFDLRASLDAKNKALEEAKASLATLTFELNVAEDTLKKEK